MRADDKNHGQRKAPTSSQSRAGILDMGEVAKIPPLREMTAPLLFQVEERVEAEVPPEASATRTQQRRATIEVARLKLFSFLAKEVYQYKIAQTFFLGGVMNRVSRNFESRSLQTGIICGSILGVWLSFVVSPIFLTLGGIEICFLNFAVSTLFVIFLIQIVWITIYTTKYRGG